MSEDNGVRPHICSTCLAEFHCDALGMTPDYVGEEEVEMNAHRHGFCSSTCQRRYDVLEREGSVKAFHANQPIVWAIDRLRERL